MACFPFAPLAIAALAATVAAALPARAAPGPLDSFEGSAGTAGWQCAGWAEASRDPAGVAYAPRVVSWGATDGGAALGVPVRFAGQGYAQAYTGCARAVSFEGAASLAADVTLPAGAPSGLRAKLILLLGPAWRWTEAEAAVPLGPGATTAVRVPLAGAFDPAPERALYRDVRGYGLKVEAAGVRFEGEIAIDRVRLEDTAPPAPEDLAARAVGTFGGFVRPSGPDIPSRNGFLTFVAGASVARHALRWPKMGAAGGDLVLGEASFEGVPAVDGTLRFLDWTAVEASARLLSWRGMVSAKALLSRAFPAIRYETDGRTFGWRGGATRLAVVLDGRPTVLDVSQGFSGSLARMSEPWILLFGAGSALSGTGAAGSDVPVLLTFEKRPREVTASGRTITFSFGAAAGSVNVMPLDGLRRRPANETASWGGGLPGDVLVRCRMLVQPLAAFPVSCEERFAIDESAGTVTVTDDYAFREIRDDWGTIPVHAAAIPPLVHRAGQRGYPVSYPAGARPFETPVATFFGPFAYVRGDRATYALPLPAALDRLPVALRVEGDPAAAAARAEVERLVRESAPSGASSFYLDNDDRAAAFLSEAYPTLPAGGPERARAAALAPALIEHGFLDSSLQTLVEPVTGQRYLNAAKYWASAEPFDKEWYTGRQLAALALAAETFDLDLARGVWPKARGLYRYDRIFFDWATGSALSSVFGLTALADGIHFAWEGMLGTARLARLLGDDDTWRDAAYRSARQQAALYAAWHQAEWVRDLDYAIGHLTGAKVAAADVETRGAVDGFVEETGATTLEFRSFWQTTNFVFFDVVPQFSFYRDFGLDGRVRTVEYDAMPAAHPRFADGDAFDPVDQKYYGAEYTAAHLAARAALFHDDPAALLAVYDGAAGTAASQQWYTMRRFGIAGPTALAIERARAPVVEVPAGAARVDSAVYDAAAGRVTLELAGRRDGVAVVRFRPPGGQWVETRVTLRAGATETVVLP